MAKFEGKKQSTQDVGTGWTTEYVQWLEGQIESFSRSNAALRRQLEASHSYESRRFRYDHDYVEYPDDDYDR